MQWIAIPGRAHRHQHRRRNAYLEHQRQRATGWRAGDPGQRLAGRRSVAAGNAKRRYGERVLHRGLHEQRWRHERTRHLRLAARGLGHPSMSRWAAYGCALLRL